LLGFVSAEAVAMMAGAVDFAEGQLARSKEDGDDGPSLWHD
jgi:hypothetical protein